MDIVDVKGVTADRLQTGPASIDNGVTEPGWAPNPPREATVPVLQGWARGRRLYPCGRAPT
jgi:hypothetical protein